jgi:adenosine kinase
MYRHVHDLAEMHTPFFFDPGQPLSAFSKEQLHQIMKVTPYLIVNEYEKDLFCKIASIGFDDLIMGFEKVLVTLGSQ